MGPSRPFKPQVMFASQNVTASIGRMRRASLGAGVLFIFLLASANGAKADEIAPGKIAPKVVCEADATQTYALYLPTAYSPKEHWPILYAFDPAARGALPVERFRDAAERYGYIVAGSNNSKNGPWGPSATAITAMMNDAASRFSIDFKRVYLTGFSGGARVACHLGIAFNGQIAGVIACGAGFGSEVRLSASIPFVFFGTAGVDDFNYSEMKRLDRSLHDFGIPVRIETFEGGHAWAPSALCMRAIEWMNVQAMKSGRIEKSAKLLDDLLAAQSEQARDYESASRLYEAYLAYSGAADEFRGLKDVTKLEEKAKELRNTAEVKRAFKKELEAEEEQARRSKELYALRAKLAQTPRSSSTDESEDREALVVDLKRALVDLKKRAEAKESTADRAMARRVLNSFLVSSFEASRSLIDNKQYDRAEAALAIDAEVMPDNSGVLYTLASVYSLKGDKKKSIETLKKAVENGFSNAKELESDSAFDSVRTDSAFTSIIETLKKKR
jgi:dienelactone hydrolase